MQKYAEMRGFGHKKRTVHKELPVCGRGMRTCTLRSQNFVIRFAHNENLTVSRLEP